MGTLSVTVGFLLIGFGIASMPSGTGSNIGFQNTSGTGSGTHASRPSEISQIPLATPIELSVELARHIGLAPDYAGRIAVASDHQIAAAVAAAVDTADVPDSTVVPLSHPPTDSTSTAPKSFAPGNSLLQYGGDKAPEVRLEIRLEVRLRDGSVTGARVISSRSGVALIELDQPPQLRGHQLAQIPPRETDEVVLLTEKPHTIPYARLSDLLEGEPLQLVGGTPVVNADGLLLGLCVEHSQGVYIHFISVNEMLSAAISAPTRRPSHRD